MGEFLIQDGEISQLIADSIAARLSIVLDALRSDSKLAYTHESWRGAAYIQFDPQKKYIRLRRADGKKPRVQYRPGGPWHINDCLDIGMQPPDGWVPYKKKPTFWQRIFPWSKN